METRIYTTYDQSKHPESSEQDLHSPLLSKRHKYEKDDGLEGVNTTREHLYERLYDKRFYDERSRSKAERYRGKENKRHTQRKKHKRHKENHEKRAADIIPPKTVAAPAEKWRTPHDPELIVRRAKLLTTEQEQEKRKGTARRELEARRELRIERTLDTLSPTAVAAIVTAGLNFQIKRKKSADDDRAKRKRARKSTNSSADDEPAEEGDDEDVRVSISDSRNHSALSVSRSISRLRSHKLIRSRSRSIRSSLSHITRSRSRSRSRSHSSEHSIWRSKSHSSSRSRSHSATSCSRSVSRSRSRSRSGSDMKANSYKEEKETKYRLCLSESDDDLPAADDYGNPLPNYYPGLQGCRSVEEYQCLNRIDEGTYGVVYRAKDKQTNEIFALKRLKLEKEKEGFPITSLREINTLIKGQHPNIVTLREVVVGSNIDNIFIVMDYVEHDLQSLMETMKAKKQSFLPGQIKCLTQQLLKAVAYLHDNWILHRDLKTSNLLLSHKGILKVADFGLAREYGSPVKNYTLLVVTLWYRAPELLLLSPEYSTPIDLWSVGCIFAEFLQMGPLFPGVSEIDEVHRIFKELGTPNENIWPGYSQLPAVKNILSQNSKSFDYPVSSLRKHFADKTSDTGIDLLQGLLTYDPKQRLSAATAQKHQYFNELPVPIDPSVFPTWPAKSELEARKAMASSPRPKQLGKGDIAGIGSGRRIISGIKAGNKKSSANTGFVLNDDMNQRQIAMAPGFILKF